MSEELNRAVAAIRAVGGDEQAPPGIAIALSNGENTVSVVDGNRQELGLSSPLPMTLETQHDLASVTKVLATTTSIMRLVDDGELDIDRTVKSILASTSLDDDTTVRDLLLHRAGLWEWWPLYLEATERGDAFAVLDRLPLRYGPRTGRHYSDLGFMLLGRVVEHVSGLGLANAVAALVLDPLGLSSTRYGNPLGSDVAASSHGDEIERQMVETGIPYPVPFSVDQFDRWRQGTLVGEVNDGNAFHALGGVSGHAGLFSTVPDLLTFAGAQASASDDFLSARVREEFFSEGPDAGQALGFRRYQMRVGERLVTVIGHPGFAGTVVGWVPFEQVAIVLATNRLHVSGTPLPNDRMWALALDGAGELLGR